MSSWKKEVVPSHKCTICGALWRYWPTRDTGFPDSWNLRSDKCGPCCDTVTMGKQIVPLNIDELEVWLKQQNLIQGPDRVNEVSFSKTHH